jgi:hypothetical protein
VLGLAADATVASTWFGKSGTFEAFHILFLAYFTSLMAS